MYIPIFDQITRLKLVPCPLSRATIINTLGTVPQFNKSTSIAYPKARRYFIFFKEQLFMGYSGGCVPLRSVIGLEGPIRCLFCLTYHGDGEFKSSPSKALATVRYHTEGHDAWVHPVRQQTQQPGNVGSGAAAGSGLSVAVINGILPAAVDDAPALKHRGASRYQSTSLQTTILTRRQAQQLVCTNIRCAAYSMRRPNGRCLTLPIKRMNYGQWCKASSWA